MRIIWKLGVVLTVIACGPAGAETWRARAGLIAHREAPRLGLDAGFCRRYLTNIIRFDLGPREQAGLHHFYLLACELSLAREGIQLAPYRQGELQAAY